jgi:hypothetical protein
MTAAPSNNSLKRRTAERIEDRAELLLDASRVVIDLARLAGYIGRQPAAVCTWSCRMPPGTSG